MDLHHPDYGKALRSRGASGAAAAPLAAASAASDHPDLSALGRRAAELLASRRNAQPSIDIPPPPAGWLPASPGATRGRGPDRTTVRMVLRNLAITVAIIALGPPIAHWLLGFWP